MSFLGLAFAIMVENWFVIPGWSEGPDPESRDSLVASAYHSSRSARPGMTGYFGQSATIMAYYVYILASRKDGATYVGITNDLVRRIYEHRQKSVPGFSSKYNITRLVWFETYDDPTNAITREKELKKWKRSWKLQLIEAENPQWDDLYESICK
jgi:putative endonuclease